MLATADEFNSFYCVHEILMWYRELWMFSFVDRQTKEQELMKNCDDTIVLGLKFSFGNEVYLSCFCVTVVYWVHLTELSLVKLMHQQNILDENENLIKICVVNSKAQGWFRFWNYLILWVSIHLLTINVCMYVSFKPVPVYSSIKELWGTIICEKLKLFI